MAKDFNKKIDFYALTQPFTPPFLQLIIFKRKFSERFTHIMVEILTLKVT